MPDIRTKPLSCIADTLGIRRLYHFTPIENLPGILKHGILSRERLAGRGMTPRCPDQLRLDHAPWSISLSISWPNDRMLAAKLHEIKAGRCPDLAILALRPALMSKLPCRFIPGNAARKDLRPLVSLGPGETAPESGERALELTRLFEADGIRQRPADLPFPDDVQAEVLVAHGPIHRRYIRRIVLRDVDTLLAAAKAVPDARSLMKIDAELFGWRPLRSVKWHPQLPAASRSHQPVYSGPF